MGLGRARPAAGKFIETYTIGAGNSIQALGAAVFLETLKC